MNLIQAMLSGARRARPGQVPERTTFAAVTYQGAHDLARGLDPAEEHARRAEEKARLPVLHRPYTPGGRVAYDARQAAEQAVATSRRHAARVQALPLISIDFSGPAPQPPVEERAEGSVLPLDAAAQGECMPDHLIDEEAARYGLEPDGEPHLPDDEPPLSAAEMNEQLLLASLRSELHGAVARAAQRALGGAA